MTSATQVPVGQPLVGASFQQAVRRFFGGYAMFTGRSSRSEFWYSYLFVSLLSLVPGLIMGIGVAIALVSIRDTLDSGPPAGFVVMMIVGGLLATIVVVATLVPMLAVWARRLQDAGQSPLWLLLALIPGGSIVLLFFAAQPPAMAYPGYAGVVSQSSAGPYAS